MLRNKKKKEKGAQNIIWSVSTTRSAFLAAATVLDQLPQLSEFTDNVEWLKLGLSEDHGGSEGEDAGPLLQKLEASLFKGHHQHSKADSSTAEGDDDEDGHGSGDAGLGGGDLFSEIHLNEVKQLERQLDQMEAEKNALTQRLRDAQEASDVARQEAAARHLHLSKLDVYLAGLLHLHEAVETPANASVRHRPFFPRSSLWFTGRCDQCVDSFNWTHSYHKLLVLAISRRSA